MVQLIENLAATKGSTPVVCVLAMGSPSVPKEYEVISDAIVAGTGVSDEALIATIAGENIPTGMLPVTLPINMATVELSYEDAPHDMVPYYDSEGNHYAFGFGLTYGEDGETVQIGVGTEDARYDKFITNNKYVLNGRYGHDLTSYPRSEIRPVRNLSIRAELILRRARPAQEEFVYDVLASVYDEAVEMLKTDPLQREADELEQKLREAISAAENDGNFFVVGTRAGPGGTVSGAGLYAKDYLVTLIATPKDNYDFDGWYVNTVKKDAPATYSFNANANCIFDARFNYIGGGGGTGGYPSGSGGGGELTLTKTEPGGIGITPDVPLGVPEIPETPDEPDGTPPDELEKPIPVLDKSGAKGYISGYPDNTVRAENDITRYETAVVFYNLVLDESKASYAQQISKFSDVDAGEWYSEAVGYLVAAEILLGYPDGTFMGDNPITRAEFATIISKFGELNLDGAISFTDVESDDWAYGFITSAFNDGLIKGYPDGTFRPDNNITRAEAVTIINRMLEWDSSDIGDASTGFTDLAIDEWYYNDIVLAVNGIQPE
jgi:hypothetical protein